MAGTKKKTRSDKTGAVLVIGGGVGGIQAALDLANAGQKVFLVERSPSIGGKMALLDKTFPTNDCSMCILSPKIVECGRHTNIELITMAEVLGVDGEPGRFQARIRRQARYVDLEKCTGCGLCLEKCPRRPKTPEAQLHGHGAIYRPFPQALPNAPAIDKAMCLFLCKGTCGACKKVCPSGAILFEDQDREETLEVGSVVVVPGFEEFDPAPAYDSGYSRYPDVVTSMEFERMLCASGPYGGHVVRPSDGKEPARIAFIQCVGSRDVSCGNGYCSSVCCMYAIKEAVIAKEHMKGLDVTVFNMDIRAFGKDFERYYERARTEYGVRFVRGRVSGVARPDGQGDVVVRYAAEGGSVTEQPFDMVVLSVGLKPSDRMRELARRLGVRSTAHGFVWTDPRNPLRTSREGVFVGGAASGPKDIPETVTQASGAACEVSRMLKDARHTLTTERVYPTERDVSAETPRIGVFVCHCGTNIGGVVNVPSVTEFAKGLPGVVYAEENLYACAQDSQAHLRDVILEHKLNRVVVASCSPRTHEPLFQQTLREAGLNPYLFEMANIRDQCSWIHMREPAEATIKSRALVRMAVAKAARLEGLKSASLSVTHSALVLGGGLAGMTAALAVADQGFDVTLVERTGELGGNLNRVRSALQVPDVGAFLRDLVERVQTHPRIQVRLNAELTVTTGFVGSFESTLAVNGEELKIKHGVVIVATGGKESVPEAFAYGDRRVMTQLEFEALLANGGLPANLRRVVMVQCAGSREPEHPYCSRICCSTAVKNAMRLKEKAPSAEVYVLHRDVRTYGFTEEQYALAREAGVIFVRYEAENKPRVTPGKKALSVEVLDPLTGIPLALESDLVVLSSRIDPNPGNEELGKKLKVPLNQDRFFLEAHVKLRPVEFATEGVFVAGLAHGPKSIPETIVQAQAAAGKAGVVLSMEAYEAEPTVAALNEDLCDGCGICVPVCEYNALEIVPRPRSQKDEKLINIREAMCKGCGGCVAACPSGAMEQKGFKNDQVLAMIRAALED